VECEFTTLGKRLELEKAIEKEVVERFVGRPRKELEAILLIPKVKKLEGLAPLQENNLFFYHWILLLDIHCNISQCQHRCPKFYVT